MFNLSTYDNLTGRRRRLGSFPSLADAQAACNEPHDEWNGAEHRGGHPNTWTAMMTGRDAQFVIRKVKE